jgi:tRNA A-37 threonylcarbamoyl transferase component Bud32
LRIGEAIASGTRSTVYVYGPQAVAKVPLPTTPDSWIRHEAIYTEAVRAVGAPAPKMFDVVDIDGRLAGVYERIYGPSMLDVICDSPARAEEMGRLLGELHAQILGIVAPLTIPRQRDRLAGKIRRAAFLADASLMDAAALIPTDSLSTRLCHGDLHPGNVIMSADGPVVIDWFDACRGAATGDVARSSLLMGADGATLGSIPHLARASIGAVDELHSSYLSAIQERLLIDRLEFERWRRIEAAARLSEGLAPTELLAVWNSEPVDTAAGGHRQC